MNVLDLFSGIGGFSLGLERAGMRTVAFCEIEPYCRAVLRKHWPNVPIYDDVRTLTAERLKADGISVDLICGGFPCQDISTAGKGAGITGERSGLWSEYARLIGEIRPKFVVVENVAALLGRGLSRVLGDLAEIGYDAEWQIISAADVGALHRRERAWIVAYPSLYGWGAALGEQLDGQTFAESSKRGEILAYTESTRRETEWVTRCHEASEGGFGGVCSFVGNSPSLGQSGQGEPFKRGCEASDGERQANIFESICIGGKWATEPDVGRVAHGIPSRVDRLKGLGNAVVPQIPELIGRAIMETMQ